MRGSVLDTLGSERDPGTEPDHRKPRLVVPQAGYACSGGNSNIYPRNIHRLIRRWILAYRLKHIELDTILTAQ